MQIGPQNDKQTQIGKTNENELFPRLMRLLDSGYHEIVTAVVDKRFHFEQAERFAKFKEDWNANKAKSPKVNANPSPTSSPTPGRMHATFPKDSHTSTFHRKNRFG